MRKKNVVLAPIVSALVILTMSITACIGKSGTEGVGTEWREEVQLSSGEIIVVKRTADTGKVLRELGGPSTALHVTMSMAVEASKTAPVPPPFNAGVVPMVFDYDAAPKEWFVVASFYTCDVWENMGKPSLPYFEYRVRNGQWQRVELTKALFGRETNLLVSPKLDGEKSYMPLAEKLQLNKSAADIYRKIYEMWPPYSRC